MTNRFIGKYIIGGKIEALTGLHIGGSTIGLEIGGLDNPVIKDPLSNQPYIPGSSLKGKLRSLLEWYWGLIEKNDKDEFKPYSCEDLASNQNSLKLARIFGPNSNESSVRTLAGPTRLTIRDSFLNKSSIENLTTKLGDDVYTEVKTENALDRVTSAANPRPLERVPKGTTFDICFILDKYEMKPDTSSRDLLQAIFTSMSLLEHSSLGGGGSRGSGQVAFRELKLTWRSAESYAKGDAGVSVELPAQTVDEILKNIDEIKWPH
jgi:CRISPR-associated protein Csm3